MDGEIYFLVHKLQLGSTNIRNKDNPVVGWSKPVSIVSGREVPEDTQQYRNLKQNERGHETLDYYAAPEISLLLFTYQRLYRASIEREREVNQKNCQKRTKLIMLHFCKAYLLSQRR